MSVTETRVDESSEELGTSYFDGLKPGDIREISSDKLFICSKGDRVSHDTRDVLKKLNIDDESWAIGAVQLDEGRYLFVRGVELVGRVGADCYLIHEQERNRHDRALSERLYAVGLNNQTE